MTAVALQNRISFTSTLRNSAWIQKIKRYRHSRLFRTHHGGGLHHGVFSSFAEARAALPTSKGFECPDVSKEYVDVRSKRIYPFDYPVLFWLREVFAEGGRSLLDVGGSVGVHFYSYRPYIEFPNDLSWNVLELPSVVQLGRKLAASKGAQGLYFTDSLNLENCPDILIAAGSIEFFEHGFIEDLLSSNAHCRPRHIFLNKVPMYDGEQFVSVHNLGQGAYAPHHVFNKKSYLKKLELLGYRLIDFWDVPERKLILPGHPDRSFNAYSGMYLRAG